MAREIAYVSPGRLVVDGTASDVGCHVATGFFDRLLGLMGQPEIATSEMMVFPRCRSVHTFWMRVRIDVAWLGEPDADGVMPVVGLAPSLGPGRVAVAPRGAWGCAEAKAGTMPPGSTAFLRLPGLLAGGSR